MAGRSLIGSSNITSWATPGAGSKVNGSALELYRALVSLGQLVAGAWIAYELRKLRQRRE